MYAITNLEIFLNKVNETFQLVAALVSKYSQNQKIVSKIW